MSKIKILTDSAADMPAWITEEYEDILDIVSLGVVKDDVVYPDKEYSQDILYKDMKDGVVYTTNQVTLGAFIEKFEEYAKNNIPAIYIGFTSALSGTYSTGLVAMKEIREKYPDWQCEAIDSKNATFAEGLIVYKILKKIRVGMIDINELANYGRDLSERLYLVAYIADLQYLVRGGRLSAAAGILGNALSIKPLIIIDEEGKLVVKDKCRGKKKAYKKMVEEIAGSLDEKEGFEIATMYTDDSEELSVVEDMIKKEYPQVEFIRSRVGAIIGAHVGPGAMGFAFIGKNKK